MKSNLSKKVNQFLDIDKEHELSQQELKQSVDQDIQKILNQTNNAEAQQNVSKSSEVNQYKRSHGQSYLIVEPMYYKDAQTIAEALVNGKIIYIYLTKLSTQEANRIIDFLTGVVYGLNGDIERLDQELFICTPTEVEITDELRTKI